MKIVQSLPPEAAKGEFVVVDIEMFQQEQNKLHLPTGFFACLSISYERDPKTVYQIYDEKEVKKVIALSAKGVLAGHNMMYDLRQLRRYATIKPRFIWDSQIVDECMHGGYYTRHSLREVVLRELGIVMEKEVRNEFITASRMTNAMKTYAAKDAYLTMLVILKQREQFKDDPGFRVYEDIDQAVIFPVLDFKPIKVNVPEWVSMTEGFVSKVDEIQGALGFNVMSTNQVKSAVQSRLGITLRDTGKDTLKRYEKSSELFRDILNARTYRKAVSTYGLSWLEANTDAEGYVRSDFKISRAKTGRMSCVSGNTLLYTNRGPFRIEDYVPVDGDTIQTHTGKQQPILRKIFKGYEPMIRVECSDGSVVQCTHNHRIQTSKGWERVGDLIPGSEVITYVNLEAVCEQRKEYQDRPPSLFRGRPQTWLSGDSRRVGDSLCQCTLHSKSLCRWREKTHRAVITDVPFKTWKQKSNVRQNGGATPQLQGADRGRAWLRSTQGERQVPIGTSAGHGTGAGPRDLAVVVGCSSHRRGQAEQQSGQPCACDSLWSWQIASHKSSIISIAPLGTMAVWDIEVANDHSYIAGGLVHHNSSSPNMQNIPQRTLPIFRKMFIPSPGNIMMVTDINQQEPSILAFESNDASLLKAVHAGESTHIAVASTMFGRPITKADPEYAIGKQINLGLSYGLTEYGLAEKTNIPVEEAKKFLDIYFKKFPGVHQYIQAHRRSALDNGYVRSAFGRRIYINPYDRQWQNIAINAPIQGGAADFTKLWIIQYWKLCKKRGLDYCLAAPVHDELVLDVPKKQARETKIALDDALEATGKILYPGIPFRSETESGYSWACKQLKEEIIDDADLDSTDD